MFGQLSKRSVVAALAEYWPGSSDTWVRRPCALGMCTVVAGWRPRGWITHALTAELHGVGMLYQDCDSPEGGGFYVLDSSFTWPEEYELIRVQALLARNTP